jgi:hypothetical protein
MLCYLLKQVQLSPLTQLHLRPNLTNAKYAIRCQ